MTNVKQLGHANTESGQITHVLKPTLASDSGLTAQVWNKINT